MKINYNVTGNRRKELARVISQITGAKAEYQYMPTCAYVIDFFTLSKEGMLEFSDRSNTEIVEEVLEGIAAAGFECEAADSVDEADENEVSEQEEALDTTEDSKTAENTETAEQEPETTESAENADQPKGTETPETDVSAEVTDEAAETVTTEELETADAADSTEPEAETPIETEPKAPTKDSESGEAPWLTISLPLDKVDAGKLTRILEAKGNLIKKALGVDSLPIEIGEDTISFPWFSELPDADTSTAYTHFISALCKMSKEQKRVTATKKEVTNEKYTFRCFLLRLGFIGEEYKTDRKILLKNLTGSSAFKSGARKEAAADEA